MPGLITAGLLGGLGAGLGKYEEQQEKERAAELENERALGRAKYSSELQKGQAEFAAQKAQEAKIAEEERNREKMREFEGVARDWKAANPEAKLTDFVNHFSTTEYAPLLKPMIEAAGLEKQAAMYEKQGKESEARLGLIDKQLKAVEESTINARIRASQPTGGGGGGSSGGGGAKGGGSTAGGTEARLSEKDYNKVHRDAQEANPIYDTTATTLAGEKPPLDTQAMGVQGKLMRQFYDLSGNTALAEQQAVAVMRSAVEFARDEKAKAGGKATAAQWQRWLEQGAQKRLYDMDKEAKEAKRAELENRVKESAWGGEGRMARGTVTSPTYGVSGTWEQQPESTGGASSSY